MLGPEVFDLVARNQMKKGDVLTVAQLAGAWGAIGARRRQAAGPAVLCFRGSLSSRQLPSRRVGAVLERRAQLIWPRRRPDLPAWLPPRPCLAPRRACAGVMGAKHTSTLIPLCHNILLSKVHVALALEPRAAAVDITASATTVGPTGVEMEALTAAAVAALCVYDMCKAASKGILVTDLRLLSKSGGRSGDWRRGGEESAGL